MSYSYNTANTARKQKPSWNGETRSDREFGNSVASGSTSNSAVMSMLGLPEQESGFLQPNLIPGSGRSVQMPDALRTRLEQHFGIPSGI